MAKSFQKLTRPAIRKLKLGEKLQESGITFERLADGDGKYSINIMVDGQRIHRVVGKESDGTTRTQAEDFIAKLRSDAKNNRLALPKGRKTALQFSSAAEKYMARLHSQGGRDLKMKSRRLALHLVPFFGQKPLDKISAFDIERYKKSRREDKPQPSESTVNRELAVLSHLLNQAIDWEWITAKPRIKLFKESSGRITYLTVDQAKRLVEVAKSDSSPHIYPFIVIGLATSMRLSEILSINKKDIDLDRRMIFIPKAKAGAREQPITAELANFLKGYIEGTSPHCEWLFPSPASETGHAVSIRKPFRRVVEAAGMDPDQVVRHTLRHTAITHLVQAGVDLPTVKRISGHKTLAMVERYAHANGDHIQEAMDKLEARMKTG